MDALASRILFLLACAALLNGCHKSEGEADLVSKLGLQDMVELIVKYRQLDNVAPLRITGRSAVREIMNDLKSAGRGRSAKWEGVAKCTVRRARGDEVLLWIYGRRDDRLGEVLIVKTDEGFYELRGKLLEMMQKHVGGMLLRPEDAAPSAL